MIICTKSIRTTRDNNVNRINVKKIPEKVGGFIDIRTYVILKTSIGIFFLVR